MKLTGAPQDIANVASWEELRRYTSMSLSEIIRVLAGGVSFSDNVDCEIQAVTFNLAGQEVAIQHKLKRNPSGYFAVKKSAPVDLYNGTKENNDTTLYLRANAAATVTVVIF